MVPPPYLLLILLLPNSISYFRMVNSTTGIWTSEEDERLKHLVEEHGTGNWSLIGDFFVDRTGKQCRERWTNHLSPGLKKGEWTEEVHQYRDALD